IALIKQAGFTLVRMGDLSWDAFEPSEGQFEFAWFDNILEQMNHTGIKVVLDIGGSPAPVWLHHKYRTVNMVNEQGATVYPAERPSPPERYLDLRRFWSEVTISVLEDLEKVRERNVPNLPAVSNLLDTASRRGFDYLSSYKKYVSYGAEGFYPANPLDVSFSA